MPTLGSDSQLILTHALVNSGNPTGFMLADGTAISCQRTANQVTPATGVNPAVYSDETKLFASIVCADFLQLPNGARDTRTRAQVYNALIAYLAQHAGGIGVTTPVGIYANMFSLAHLATEAHYPGYTVVICSFSNLNTAFAPVDPFAYSSSLWVDVNSYVGAMNWGNSLWR